MLMRHAFAGLPLMRTRTGSGLRQPGLMTLAREGLTRMKGVTPRILMTALKPTFMEPTKCLGGVNEAAWIVTKHEIRRVHHGDSVSNSASRWGVRPCGS